MAQKSHHEHMPDFVELEDHNDHHAGNPDDAVGQKECLTPSFTRMASQPRAGWLVFVHRKECSG